ncbi:GNAT family N-acetyltransferase [Halocatena marina]|uniref:GNAT family N-acetyltransferase n=1 Tax=Halocatena marina TaxID=2934937 RepID=UPI00200EA5F2|nr:GNAT family N-acetyltransferase [Halocatena marina]
MRIEKLTLDSVPAAMQLSKQAGWNQCRADWELLLTLAPDHCFAGWIGDDLIATTTVVTYGGDVSWIGMVLVSEEHRGQGYGSQIFQTALEATLERGQSAIGLDATPFGRGLYSKNDFVEIAPITRWRGTLQPRTTTDDVTELKSIGTDPVCSFDRRAVGVNRRDLLGQLLDRSDCTCLALENNDENGSRGETNLSGYAVLRPGRQHWQLGPIVAETETAYAQLVSGAAKRCTESVVVDAPTDGGDDLLTQSGLTPERRLVRMAHAEPQPLLLNETVKAVAGLEWG